MSRKQQRPVLSMVIILTFVASAVITLTEFGSMIISAQAQVNASTLTPEQKDAICNPNNPTAKLNPVNTTESRICGIPVTLKPSNATTTSSNITTGAQAPPSPPPPATSIAPSANPPS